MYFHQPLDIGLYMYVMLHTYRQSDNQGFHVKHKMNARILSLSHFLSNIHIDTL